MKLPHLTPTQLKVLKGWIEGSGIKSTASRAGISPRAVKYHRRTLQAKLGMGFNDNRLDFIRRLGHFEVQLTWVPNKRLRRKVA